MPVSMAEAEELDKSIKKPKNPNIIYAGQKIKIK